MKITEVSPSKLVPFERNPRVNKKAVDKVVASIERFGFNQPVVCNQDNIICVGHTRWKAAKKMGLKKIPVYKVKMTEAEFIAYNIADNKTSELSSWDEIILKELVCELDQFEDNLVDYTGFSDDELNEILLGDDLEADSSEPKEPEIPKLKKTPATRKGDVWLLGRHRLMCGNSIMVDDVKKLMNEKLADMVFTDPPYNTGMTEKTQEGSGGLWKGKGKKGRLSHMFNDSFTDDEWEVFMGDFCSMYNSFMRDDSVAYICLDWRRNHELIPHIKKNFRLSNVIVWDKVIHGLGSDYKYTYELINVCKKGNPNIKSHQGDREYSDVWHIQRAMGKNENHATAKPVELVERCIRHGSKRGDLVVDLFQGSGTTFIACENANRICYGMEMSESYCDVIVERWQNLTGKNAVLESTKEKFNDLLSGSRGK